MPRCARPPLPSVCSTGSPLSEDGFRWVYQAMKPDVHLASISGGTDLCGCFVGGDPTRPVFAGEIQGPGLGMDVGVFDSEGKLPPQEPFGREIKSTEKAIRRYTGQIAYTNKRILEAVDRILKDEEEPPVIILQGDHGFRRLPPDHPAQQRVVSSILNAYYLPPTAGELPGPSISPVNSFRLVFNGYLGGRFGYLPDESYYSPPGGKTGVFLRIEH